LPYLAAKIPLPPREAFFLLHCLFWLGTMAFFVLICRRLARAPNFLTLLAVLWLQIHWLGIPRAAAQYTYIVESASLFFMTALTYLVFARKHGLLIVSFALVGAVFKESIVLWCLCLTFGVALDGLRRKIFDKGALAWLLAACVGAFAVSTACKTVFLMADKSSAVGTLTMWANTRLLDPFAFLRYESASFNALGGFVVLLIAFLGKVERSDFFPLPAVWGALAAYLAICFFSGSDLTRFAFESFSISLPAVLYLAKDRLERLPSGFVFAIILLSLPVSHLFGLELSPALGHELPNQEATGPYSWMMEYAHRVLVVGWLAWFCVIAICATKYCQRKFAPSREAAVR